MKKTLIASAIGLALVGTGAANASEVFNIMGAGPMSTDRANFTMLAANGGIVGGTNDVHMLWDGNAFTSSSDYTGPGSVANVTASSVTAFFGTTTFWTAHDIQVFIPGSYTFDTTLGSGNAESGIMSMNVGANQLGMHMLFDWNGNKNIDVVVVANQNQQFGSGNDTFHESGSCKTSGGNAIAGANCLWAGPGFAGSTTANRPADHTVWMLASVDQTGGDGIPGTPMATNGPFAGFNANFNANLAPAAVPVPAAAWLFGSGLLGLVGIARRKKKA